MKNLGWILVVIGAMMWGVDGVLFTPRYFTYGLFNVVLIVFMAHLIPTFIMSVTNYKEYLNFKNISKSDLFYLLLIALFGGTIGTLSIVQALKLSEYNPYSLVILIQKSQPIFAILSAYIILKEKPGKRFYKVFVIAIISLYFLTFGLSNPFNLEVKSLYACLFSLVAAISFGISTTFGRKVSLNLSASTSTFYRFLLTTIITGVMLIVDLGNTIESVTYVRDNKYILVLAVIIAVWGMVAVRIYYNGLIRTSAVYATICELAFPLTSVVLDMFVNANYLDPVRLISGLVLLVTIVYLNLNNEK